METVQTDQEQSDLEARDRIGYQSNPQRVEEYQPWEEIAAWPED